MAQFKFFDAVWESFTTTGTGAITPNGVIPGKGLQSIASVLSSGDSSIFTADKNGQRQTFLGTWNGTTVARTATLYSTAGGTSNADFAAGTGEIFMDIPAAFLDALYLTEITVASATTCDIGAVYGGKIAISGTTTITSLGSGANKLRFVRFTGALTLTHNGTSLILPGAANITTVAGDTAIFASDSSGNWRCHDYMVAALAPFDRRAPGAIGGTTPSPGSFTTLTTSGTVLFNGNTIGIGNALGSLPKALFQNSGWNAIHYVGITYSGDTVSLGANLAPASTTTGNLADTSAGGVVLTVTVADWTVQYTAAGANVRTLATSIYGNNVGAIFLPNVGTTASAANAFISNGTTPANQVLRSTSSLAYKCDVEPLDEKYADRILELIPIWYRSKAPADNPNWGWYGLGAEDVAKIDPRLVHWTYPEDAYEMVEIVSEIDVPDMEDQEETATEFVVNGDRAIARDVTKVVQRQKSMLLPVYLENGEPHLIAQDEGNPIQAMHEVLLTKKDKSVTTERRLKEGAQMVPDGVQYERLAVLLLSIVKRMKSA